MQADKASSTEHRWFCYVLHDKKRCSDLPESVCSMMVPSMILPYLTYLFSRFTAQHLDFALSLGRKSEEFVMAAVLKNPEVLQCIELQDVHFVETLLF